MLRYFVRVWDRGEGSSGWRGAFWDFFVLEVDFFFLEVDFFFLEVAPPRSWRRKGLLTLLLVMDLGDWKMLSW